MEEVKEFRFSYMQVRCIYQLGIFVKKKERKGERKIIPKSKYVQHRCKFAHCQRVTEKCVFAKAIRFTNAIV